MAERTHGVRHGRNRGPSEPEKRTASPAGAALASAVGNRALAALLTRTAAAERSARPHPALDPGTPAWSEAGRIVLGPPSLLLSADERAGVLRHEAIHALQQRLAPVDDGPAARERAERLAGRGPGDLPGLDELSEPAPRLLAAPVSGRAASGFTRLFAGSDAIIGEVVASGVTVRIQRSYAQLGIEAPTDTTSDFPTTTMTELQYVACGDRAFPALKRIADRLGSVAARVADVGGALGKGSRWTPALVVVVSEESRMHVADGAPLITISHEDFDRAGPQTAAHEASHAVFESHTHATPDGPLAPDAFALRFADLFRRLGGTRAVPLPTRPFSAGKPSLAPGKDEPTGPAGLVMVTDTLWAAAPAPGGKTEGHPWEGPDELFASAHGAFRTDEKLLTKLIAHYAGADGSVTALGKELLDLLRTVRDPKALKALAPPGKDESAKATEAIRAREAPASSVKERLGFILDPAALPPKSVTCPKR
jgi:hypothetical protein